MNPITYCMNVHPGEDLASVQAALERVTLPVRDALHAEAGFPVGLRLGVDAAAALREPGPAKKLASFLTRNRLALIGINGFPYGRFHGTRVKKAVYEPDWSDPRRVAYTRDLFYVLHQLPTLRMGDYCPSVTTVPLGYGADRELPDAYFTYLCDTALFLRKFEGLTGKRMMLALEPEPGCVLETTQTTIDFFEQLWQHPQWHPAYRNYIGLCFDTCHFAVEYEDPLNALRTLVAARVPVARIQISAALEYSAFATAEQLAPFVDEVYLHQVRRREFDASLTCFDDLTPEVIPQLLGQGGRIHYHVPLAWEGSSTIGSTRRTLTHAFWRYVRAGGWPIEVETYTYLVSPDMLRRQTLSEALLEDLIWVQKQLRSV